MDAAGCEHSQSQRSQCFTALRGGNRISNEGGEGVDHRKSHSLDEMQQRQLPLQVRILVEIITVNANRVGPSRTQSIFLAPRAAEEANENTRRVANSEKEIELRADAF
ncbi:hypothetical protein EVAR_33289_1 [Eumeta japonica]|uniref:Uncharacterized protein n=1 Tax=Eumeta variegata TaxID=151549 RepID=A0A4C1WE42_EUMVA|nr:hypothetical protein EVAR_33289_1 [Eumeta japonica]